MHHDCVIFFQDSEGWFVCLFVFFSLKIQKIWKNIEKSDFFSENLEQLAVLSGYVCLLCIAHAKSNKEYSDC